MPQILNGVDGREGSQGNKEGEKGILQCLVKLRSFQQQGQKNGELKSVILRRRESESEGRLMQLMIA